MVRSRCGTSCCPRRCGCCPTGLARLDELLSDPELLVPIALRWERELREASRFSDRGRPSLAMETYVRLMVLKHRCGWGYETLMREVSDSIHLRRFCRLGLTERVPDESTVRKLTRRLGPEVVHQFSRRDDSARLRGAGARCRAAASRSPDLWSSRPRRRGAGALHRAAGPTAVPTRTPTGCYVSTSRTQALRAHAPAHLRHEPHATHEDQPHASILTKTRSLPEGSGALSARALQPSEPMTRTGRRTMPAATSPHAHRSRHSTSICNLPVC
jgi:Transposase domain (DUF772)